MNAKVNCSSLTNFKNLFFNLFTSLINNLFYSCRMDSSISNELM